MDAETESEALGSGDSSEKNGGSKKATLCLKKNSNCALSTNAVRSSTLLESLQYFSAYKMNWLTFQANS